MNVEWREIHGTDYRVSNLGQVSSKKSGEWRLLKPGINNVGYPLVILTIGHIRQTRTVHSLVAGAFLGPKPTPRHQVNHKNGVKTDGRADNLEWVTAKENIGHGISVLGNKRARGEAQGISKLTETQVKEIRVRRQSGEKLKNIASDFGVGVVNISNIANGKRWGWLKQEKP